MAASKKTPYELLNVPEDIQYVKLRRIYRDIIHKHKRNEISADDFRCLVRAYETLSDFDKRDRYNSRKEWISDLPLRKYTAQQLAAEPALHLILEDRLRNANLTEINAQDEVTGHTTLYCAARAGNVVAVKFLTEQGAEPDLSQRTKSTALHVASFYGHDDVVRCLLESGADYRIKNEGNSTAEDEAYNNQVQQAFTEMKQSPYVRAAADEIDWFRKNTIEQHIDEVYYTQRQTLLHCASKKGYFDLVRLFVEQLSADLDITDINGNSALHLAAYGGYETIVNYLLTKGCDSTLINRWGLTAEQEGSKHDSKITDNFQRMRDQDMFEMARNGVDWWFRYYFGTTSPDENDTNGVSLLYHACRHDQYDVAKWLLEHGANVNIQMKKSPKSTALHGAKYHGYLKIVELLLEYGADVTIKNDYRATVFEDEVADDVDRDTLNQIHDLLQEHSSSLKMDKIIDVYIYPDKNVELDKDAADKELVKVRLHPSAVYNDLLKALPDNVKSKVDHFSIARRPLDFDMKNTTVIAAVCRARYAHSKFIETPLRLTLHEEPANKKHSDRLTHQDPKFDFRAFTRRFQQQSKTTNFQLKPSKDKQKINVDDLVFTFSECSITEDLKIEVRTLFSADPEIFGIPGCVCLFEVNLYADAPKLAELPLVSIAGNPDVRLYSLATPSSYWFSSVTRRTRLPMLDGIHAFVQHISVFPVILTLPADMIFAASFEKPLISRVKPVRCTCLVLQEHDAANFPDKAYHGTTIGVIRSILADGLVMPGTVVSQGKRISPPKNHIPRGRKAFGVDDFADAVFLSPSVHYSSDLTYAVPFSHDDQQLLPVLECSVPTKSYSVYRSTVLTYVARPGDDINAIEWRISDPEKVVINAVLFIPTVDSLTDVGRERMAKINP